MEKHTCNSAVDGDGKTIDDFTADTTAKPCGRPAFYQGAGKLDYRFWCEKCMISQRAYDDKKGHDRISVVHLQPDPKPQNFAQVFQPTLLQRIGMKLFPSQFIFHPTIYNEPTGKPVPAKDGITGRIEIKLSWRDLFRLILSRRFSQAIKISTENEIGQHAINTAFSVRPPNFLAIDKQPL